MQSSSAPRALRAEGIGVSFGGLRALHRVDLHVGPGEIVGILGPNGAGKTTLFDCLSGFVECEGSVFVGDREVTALAPHQRAASGLGRSFQDARLFHTMSVLDTLKVASELRMKHADTLSSLLSLPPSRSAERGASRLAAQLIEVMGLGPYRDKLIRELSTGTRRIVDLACVLIQRPSVVLLDEPSSGIAQREAEALGPLLVSLRDRFGLRARRDRARHAAAAVDRRACLRARDRTRDRLGRAARRRPTPGGRPLVPRRRPRGDQPLWSVGTRR